MQLTQIRTIDDGITFLCERERTATREEVADWIGSYMMLLSESPSVTCEYVIDVVVHTLTHALLSGYCKDELEPCQVIRLAIEALERATTNDGPFCVQSVN